MIRSMKFSLLQALLVVFLSVADRVAWADENQIDFENGDALWKGWSATVTNAGEKSMYRQLPNWETPFSFTYDNEKPQEGSASLKWDFNGEVPGMVSLRAPSLPISGKEVLISFYVRTKGEVGEGLFCVDETSSTGQRAKAHWAASKIPASDDWVEVTWQGPLDPGTASIRLGFVYKAIPAGSCIWIDHVSMKSTP
ncbi:hypothetical protein BH09VER1_BH09VER1_12960 [soil metagenome]